MRACNDQESPGRVPFPHHEPFSVCTDRMACGRWVFSPQWLSSSSGPLSHWLSLTDVAQILPPALMQMLVGFALTSSYWMKKSLHHQHPLYSQCHNSKAVYQLPELMNTKGVLLLDDDLKALPAFQAPWIMNRPHGSFWPMSSSVEATCATSGQ